jgi:hypothetical protein
MLIKSTAQIKQQRRNNLASPVSFRFQRDNLGERYDDCRQRNGCRIIEQLGYWERGRPARNRAAGAKLLNCGLREVRFALPVQLRAEGPRSR